MQQKSLTKKQHENQQKSTKIYKNQKKSMQINKNEDQ